ncbi:arylsulfatase [Lentisphaera profundi]|uniref:Arylsulfatase n=1 Tax=Lentisphaera profundi TaxID=1658616 RepID=A0ABY7VYG2_9BACT|nr:arylsulfatase [Lentisphaera profundi]WDE98956.1 arylsulfatase [Lentisphaera profundi]
MINHQNASRKWKRTWLKFKKVNPRAKPRIQKLMYNNFKNDNLETMKNKRLKTALFAALSLMAFNTFAATSRPNIVLILCDDLGYGDVQCLNPEKGKIKTPHIDKIAEQGMTFTDAHSGSSVCTPTRYGLLTGRYSWRTRLQSGVVAGYKPCLITPDRLTVAGLLKKQGYTTAILGKWHLDFQYQDPVSGKILKRLNRKTQPPVGSKIPDGPLSRGFDSYHGFHHAGNMKAVIENDTVILHEDEINMLPRLSEKAVTYIEERAKSPDQPFFLYVPLGSPHTPIVPSKEWQGKSELGPYGDFVMQTDATVGIITDALAKNGFTDNTVVIFTSDNGCSKSADIRDLRKQGHHVSAQYRGSKADIWEGGHRVPFIVRWPGKTEAGSKSEQLITLVDFFATVSDITGEKAPNMAEDSVSFLPALSGKTIQSTRKGVIHHSISGHFAYRQGKWKLCLAKESGGWTAPKESQAGADAPKAQLYDMEKDPGEQNNLYLAHPEVAERLLADLTADIYNGRSTDGPKAKNDHKNIVLWKNQEAKTSTRKNRK